MKTVFISYAREDEQYKDRLIVQLAMLKRNKQIEEWHDRLIDPGASWNLVIKEQLNASDIIILLISPDFLNSGYAYDIEFQESFIRHQKKETIIVPIIVRFCDWKESPLKTLNVLPTDGKPIKDWDDIDEAFQNVVDNLKRIIDPKLKKLLFEKPNVRKKENISPSSNKLNLITILVALVLSIGFLFLYLIFKSKGFIDSEDSSIAYFGILIAFCSSASLLLFGILKSSGQTEGKILGLKVKFGGPAAMFLILFLLGINNLFSSTSQPITKDITIYLRDTLNNIPNLSDSFTISLDLGNGDIRRPSSKNDDGSFFTWKNISNDLLNDSINVIIKSINWKFTSGFISKLKLSGSDTLLTINRIFIKGDSIQKDDTINPPLQNKIAFKLISPKITAALKSQLINNSNLTINENSKNQIEITFTEKGLQNPTENNWRYTGGYIAIISNKTECEIIQSLPLSSTLFTGDKKDIVLNQINDEIISLINSNPELISDAIKRCLIE